MANPHRGDTDIQAGDRSYTLCFSSNAVCEMEEHFDRPIAEIGTMLDAGARFSDLRAVFWHGLRRHHPDLSLEDAGDVMDEVGQDKVGEAIGTAFQRAFPQAKGAAGGRARPRKAKG